MNVLIIEDEKPAAERLVKLLKELEPDVEILGTIVSVNSAVKWLESNHQPDLLLMDVNLADGSSFEIFERTEVKSPVIFITAYDQYAMNAFRVNSIHYLLKPVKKDDLQEALKRFRERSGAPPQQIQHLLQQLLPSGTYQKRIVIRYGEVIKIVEIKDVAYFYTEDRIHYLCTFDNLRYPVDQNLDELESVLDPAEYFRINRQFIINVKAIEKMTTTSKSRVKITLRPDCPLETIVSTERSPVFKEWLTGKG